MGRSSEKISPPPHQKKDIKMASKYMKRFPTSIIISSVQVSRSAVSDSLRPHESQHTRPPSPSPTLRVHSNSCPSSQWCHPAISSSVFPFSSCPQSLPASGSFPMSQLFAWGGQSIGVSASASVLPMNHQGNANENYNEVLLHTCQMSIIKKSANKCQSVYGKKRILVHCGWVCKLVQLLLKNIDFPYKMIASITI